MYHSSIVPRRLDINVASQACLNAPEPADSNGVDGESTVESPEDTHANVPAPAAGMQPRTTGMPPNYAMTPDQQQALQYQAYLQQQQQQSGAYPMQAAPIPGRHPGHQ